MRSYGFQLNYRTANTKLSEEVTSCATEFLLFVVKLQNISNSRHQTVAKLINLVETLADRHIVTGSVRKVKMILQNYSYFWYVVIEFPKLTLRLIVSLTHLPTTNFPEYMTRADAYSKWPYNISMNNFLL